MSFDNQRLAYLDYHLPVAMDAAKAQLAGTRTWITGADSLYSAAHTLSTPPGAVNVGALRLLQAVRGQTAAKAQDAQAAQSGGESKAKYDCASDTCSNGKVLSAIGKPFRKIACVTGIQKDLDGLCYQFPVEQTPNGPVEVMSSDGVTPSWWDADKEKLLKQAGFLVLAIVLIYLGVKVLS